MKSALSIIGALGGIATIVGGLIAVAVWFTDWRGNANFRFDALETRMDTRMDKLETRMDNMENEIRKLRMLIEERLPAE